MSKGKSDNKVFIIIAVIILFVFIGACVAVVFMLQNNSGQKIAKIYKDGELIEEINLSTVTADYTIKVDSENGNYNIIRVENGRICVSDATCPDKICVNTGYISNNAVPISCLPHKLIIKIDGETQGDPDIIVN